MQYLSIDIETTGLDPKKNQIVEIGAVLDHLGNTTPIEDLPKFRAVLMHKEITIDPYCADLHKDLWAEMLAAFEEFKPIAGSNYRSIGEFKSEGSFIYSRINQIIPVMYSQSCPYTHYVSPLYLEVVLHSWLIKVLNMRTGILIEKDTTPIKINVAGKNFGSFDLPFIKTLPCWGREGFITFNRRFLDPTILYARPEDKQLPDLQETMKRAGLSGSVRHTAVEDAISVVQILRKYFT